jgi:hypothetical protein
MTQQNTSLEDIWSQTVGDDPGPDPYANCDPCNESCSNSGLDPAPANDNNIINDFLRKAISDGQSGGTTIQSIMDQINSENRARAQDIINNQKYNDMQGFGSKPLPFAPNRPGGGPSSSSGMEVVNEGENSNPTGFAGGKILNDSVSWDPSQDVGNFRAEGFFDGRQAIAEGLGFGAAALRQALTPVPEAVADDNCSTGGNVTTPDATGTTGALPGGSNQQSGSNSRPSGTGIGGGGVNTGGGGSINTGPVTGNGTGTTGNAGGRGKK